MFTPKALRLSMVVAGCAALILALGGCAQPGSPTVSSTSPAAGATGVPLNTKISATFSEEMKPATITFTLTRAATPVQGAVDYTGVTATFTPTENSPEYPVHGHNGRRSRGIGGSAEMRRLRRSGTRGCRGRDRRSAHWRTGSRCAWEQRAGGGHVWSFTTGAGPDKIAPTVSSPTREQRDRLSYRQQAVPQRSAMFFFLAPFSMCSRQQCGRARLDH